MYVVEERPWMRYCFCEAFLKPHEICLGHAGGGVQMSRLTAGKVKIMASEEEPENDKFHPI